MISLPSFYPKWRARSRCSTCPQHCAHPRCTVHTWNLPCMPRMQRVLHVPANALHAPARGTRVLQRASVGAHARSKALHTCCKDATSALGALLMHPQEAHTHAPAWDAARASARSTHVHGARSRVPTWGTMRAPTRRTHACPRGTVRAPTRGTHA